MVSTRRANLSAMVLISLAMALSIAHAQVNVLTGHNDHARTGLNPNETMLNPTNVNIYGFGKIYDRHVNSPVFAQPLYVSNLPIPGKGTHNVVFVATMHDGVYAFDADSNVGANSQPDVAPDCSTLYVVARTKEPAGQVHRLHALDIATGNERLNSPVVIDAVVPGTASDGSADSFTSINSAKSNSALLLSGGVVHIAWCSYCDNAPYHGWITH